MKTQLRYGLGLLVAACALVAVQVVPKLEQHGLREGGSAVEAAPGARVQLGGATVRLISLEPGTADEPLPGTKPVTAIIGITPGDAAASKAMAKGCDAAVRDGADRVWGPARSVDGRKDVSTLCSKVDKNYKAILAPPGKEVTWQASFAVPKDAVSSLRVEVRLGGVADFVRLAPPPGETQRLAD